MTYSCALWSRGARTLEEAQEAKLDLVCQKLDLQPGQRVLDIGCGWGSFAIHAAQRYDVRVTGVTLSEPQAEFARRRVADQGLSDRVEIRVADYREIARPAVRRRGQHRHGRARGVEPDRRVHAAGRASPAPRRNGAEPRHRPHAGGRRRGRPLLGALRVPGRRPASPLAATGRGGALQLVTEHVEGLHGDYAITLAHWARNLDDNLDEAIRLAGPERIRVWRLYLRTARRGFETGFISVYQVRARRPGAVSAKQPGENGAARAPVAARA